ncbi:MAG: radical SAM family heme chaperone HemW [Fibrobacteria bacterium]|nr:radical SAM family heme chaperone HemW [Fibrobacteria bacterium]
MNGLYIHIPFCESKCPYCDFTSWKGKKTQFRILVDTLFKELKLRTPSGTCFDSIYIGGGTPSILPTTLFNELVNNLHKHLDFSKTREISIEANPSSITPEKLTQYKNCNINRLSIGVQSFNNSLLNTLERAHDSKKAKESIQLALDFNFQLGIDLMFGLPGQSLTAFIKDLETALHFPLAHLSLYGLTIEPDTIFYLRKKEKRLPPIDTENYDHMYLSAVELLEKNGLLRYEVSNFARKGKESLHNLNYWNHSSYLGLGPGAHSFSGTIRYANSRDFSIYLTTVKNGCPEKELQPELLSHETRYQEAIWLGLRTTAGINIEKLDNLYGKHPLTKKLNNWHKLGFLVPRGPSGYTLHHKGWLYLDTIVTDLLI